MVKTGAARCVVSMDAAERHVLDSVPVGLQIWEAAGADVRALTLCYANEEAGRQAGFDLAARIGQRLPDVFPDYDVPWNEKVLAACLSGEPQAYELHVGDKWWHAQAQRSCSHPRERSTGRWSAASSMPRSGSARTTT